MSVDVKKSISDYLKESLDISLATIGADGAPYCAIVAQANEDNRLYFITNKSTNKSVNIERNPNVAFTANKPGGDWQSIRSIQMQGTAAAVTDPSEMQRVMGLIFQKFPQMKDMPQSPDSVVIRVTFTKGYFLDYTKAFMHRDEVVY